MLLAVEAGTNQAITIDGWFFIVIAGIVAISATTAGVLGFFFSKFSLKDHIHTEYLTKDDHLEKCEYRSSRHHELVSTVQNHEATMHELKEIVAVFKAIAQSNEEKLLSLDRKMDDILPLLIAMKK